MASVGSTGRLEAFRGSLYANGLSIVRSDIRKALGVYKAADSATIRMGQFVMLNSSGEVDVSDGQNVLGVAKCNKLTAWQAVKTDEPVVFPSSGGTVTVAKPQTVTGLSIRSAINQGGTAYTYTTDFTYTSGGVITRVANIPLDTTVYVSYTYQMTASDVAADGTNFFNSIDDVTLQEGRITVITDWALLFTAEYDTSQTYATTGAGSNLYVTGATYADNKGTTLGAGILTNVAPTNYVPASGNGVGRFMGKVMQVPTATDPFLGVILAGNPVAVQAAGAPGILI